jgi:hypothetical protein
MNVDFKNPVKISADFNKEKDKYNNYSVEIPGLGFSMSLEDTGRTVLDPRTPLIEGFADNESALRHLGLIHELTFFGFGSILYRQALWSSPVLPNVANLTAMESGKLLSKFLGEDCPPPIGGAPIAAWLLDEVPETKIYELESHQENENYHDSTTYVGEREYTRRVETKAMRRHFKFQQAVRSRAVADIHGRELPR